MWFLGSIFTILSVYNKTDGTTEPNPAKQNITKKNTEQKLLITYPFSCTTSMLSERRSILNAPLSNPWNLLPQLLFLSTSHKTDISYFDISSITRPLMCECASVRLNPRIDSVRGVEIAGNFNPETSHNYRICVIGSWRLTGESWPRKLVGDSPWRFIVSHGHEGCSLVELHGPNGLWYLLSRVRNITFEHGIPSRYFVQLRAFC